MLCKLFLRYFVPETKSMLTKCVFHKGLRARGRLVWVRGLASVETRRLGYSEYGDPARVVSLVTERIQADLGPGQVQRTENNHVRMLMLLAVD